MPLMSGRGQSLSINKDIFGKSQFPKLQPKYITSKTIPAGTSFTIGFRAWASGGKGFSLGSVELLDINGFRMKYTIKSCGGNALAAAEFQKLLEDPSVTDRAQFKSCSGAGSTGSYLNFTLNEDLNGLAGLKISLSPFPSGGAGGLQFNLSTEKNADYGWFGPAYTDTKSYYIFPYARADEYRDPILQDTYWLPLGEGNTY